MSKPYYDFKSGPDGFLRDMQAKTKEQLETLLAVCAKSSDPLVTGHYARWSTLNEFTEYLANPRKEKAG